MKSWVKMPSNWLKLTKDDPPLVKMGMKGSELSNNIAALMLYITITHHAHDKKSVKLDVGEAKLSYSELHGLTGLSRAKISAGLGVLYKMALIENVSKGRDNLYKINNFPVDKENGWSMLPAEPLYSSDRQTIKPFQEFHLRKEVELNALKIYLLMVAHRDWKFNQTKMSYDKISDYTGIRRNKICSALSFLVGLDLLHIGSIDSEKNDFNVNVYRIRHIDSTRHRGNLPREDTFEQFIDSTTPDQSRPGLTANP